MAEGNIGLRENCLKDNFFKNRTGRGEKGKESCEYLLTPAPHFMNSKQVKTIIQRFLPSLIVYSHD